MPNTYTQLYTHVVFAVKGRANLVSSKWSDELYKYISGIVSSKNQKMMIINGMPDHIHILLGLKPDCNLSDLVGVIKANSSRWIKENNFVAGKFEWQTGFGAFSVSQSKIDVVVNYILHQQEHHKKQSFREEYVEFLTGHNIDFKPEYLLEDVGSAPSELNFDGG